jgi:hypothetical protein
LAALLGAAVFFDCGGEDGSKTRTIQDGDDGFVLGTFEGLSAKTEKQILRDYYNAYIKDSYPGAKAKDFYIAGYYGTYDGWVTVIILGSWGVPDSYPWKYPGPNEYRRSGSDIIGNVQFYYGDLPPPLVWKDGIFFTIVEAYYGEAYYNNPVYLTRDHIKSIAGLINPRDYEGLGEETLWRISQDYADMLNSLNLHPNWSYSKEDWPVVRYWGTYNGAVVVGLPNGSPHPVMIYHTIEGVYFGFVNPPDVWKDGYFFGYDSDRWMRMDGRSVHLQEAFDAGVLTVEDLRSIAELMELKFPFAFENKPEQ